MLIFVFQAKARPRPARSLAGGKSKPGAGMTRPCNNSRKIRMNTGIDNYCSFTKPQSKNAAKSMADAFIFVKSA